jgi:hypothetical protein
MNRVMRRRLTFRELSELRVRVSEMLRNAHLDFLELKGAADDRAESDEAKPPTSWTQSTTAPYLSMAAIVDLAAMQIVEDVLFHLARPESAAQLAQVCDANATFPAETKIAFPDAIEVESFAKRAPVLKVLAPFMREQLIKMAAKRMASGVVSDVARFLARVEEDIYDLLDNIHDTSRIVRVFKKRKGAAKKKEPKEGDEEEEDEDEEERELSLADVITALLAKMRWDASSPLGGRLQLSLLEDYEVPEDAEPVSIKVALKELERWLESNVFVPAARARTPTHVHAYASVQRIALHLGTHVRAIFLTRSEDDNEESHAIIMS